VLMFKFESHVYNQIILHAHVIIHPVKNLGSLLGLLLHSLILKLDL